MTKPLAMVIDDDENLNEAFALALELSGFDVERVRDSRNALPLMRERLPAVVTLDMNMPHLSGIEVLQAIRNDPQIAGTKVIVVTASPQAVQDKHLYDQADVVLIKPVTLSQIMNMAQRLVGQTG